MQTLSSSADSSSGDDDDDDGSKGSDIHGDDYGDDEEQGATPIVARRSDKQKARRRAAQPSLLTRIACCCCFMGCCYRDPDRRTHCTSRWCFHARQAAFDFFVNLLLFLFCGGAFIAYTVFLGRTTEQGTALLRFVNVTYVQETFVGSDADGAAFQLRVWAVNLIISRTATISLLAIALFFAIINLIRRVMMCPETRQWGVLVLSIFLLLSIAVSGILVSYEQSDSRERLLQKTDMLARQIDEYGDWLGLVASNRPAVAQPPVSDTHSNPDNGTRALAPDAAADALRSAAGDFVNTLMYKLPESVRVYALFVTTVILSFINLFR